MRTRSAARARTSFILGTLFCALAVAAVVLLSMQLPEGTAPHRSSMGQTSVR